MTGKRQRYKPTEHGLLLPFPPFARHGPGGDVGVEPSLKKDKYNPFSLS
jgi:hypothetical protein